MERAVSSWCPRPNPERRMQLHLDASMRNDLDSILSAAEKVMDRARTAYNAGTVTQQQVDCVWHLRNDLGQLLAKFSDGASFTGSDYQVAALGAMRCYEQMADDWLEAVWCDDGHGVDEVTKVAPGRYVVSRVLETIDGAYVRNSITCNNPAVAAVLLDQWEDAREA